MTRSLVTAAVLSLTILSTFKAFSLESQTPCGDTAPMCDGQCPEGGICIGGLNRTAATSGMDLDGCFCVQIVLNCESSIAPTCGGRCPPGEGCFPSIGGNATTSQRLPIGGCACQPIFVQTCGTAPTCGGECPEGFTCRDALFATSAPKDSATATTSGSMMERPCICEPETPPGACCLPNQTCEQLDVGECQAAGGSFLGFDTPCSDQCSDPGDFEASQCATPFEDISGTGTMLALPDDNGMVVNLGFSFEFYSNTQTTTAVTSNGYLTFGSDLFDFTEDPIPSTLDPNALIAPMWTDLNPGAGGTVQYQQLGIAPNRRFVAQWTAVPEFIIGGSNTLQAILFEGSNAIEFRYGAFTAASASVGTENALGTVGTAVDFSTISEGDCIRLTPVAEAPNIAVARALDSRSLIALVMVLAAVAFATIRRMRSSR